MQFYVMKTAMYGEENRFTRRNLRRFVFISLILLVVSIVLLNIVNYFIWVFVKELKIELQLVVSD